MVSLIDEVAEEPSRQDDAWPDLVAWTPLGRGTLNESWNDGDWKHESRVMLRENKIRLDFGRPTRKCLVKWITLRDSSADFEDCGTLSPGDG